MEKDRNNVDENLHKNHRQRVFDRLQKDGLDSFYDHEVLELILFYTIPRLDTNPIAHRLMDEFGSLSAVFNADASDLMKVKGVSKNSAVLISMIPQLSKRYSVASFGKKASVDSFEKATEYLRGYMLNETKEVFLIICLDKNNRIIATEKLKEGNTAELIVNPRAAVVAAAKHEPEYVIFAHNHPGGSAYPSEEDVKCTKKIALALGVIGIRIFDHIIIGEGDEFSFKKAGIMANLLNDVASQILR